MTLFDREAGAYEALRRKLREFTPLDDPSTVGIASSNISTQPPAPSVAVGGAPTVFVAASDASTQSTELAHFVCDGTNDETTFADAEAAISDTGRILLSEGTFTLAAGYTVPETISLIGMGAGATTINSTLASGYSITARPGATLRDFTLTNSSGGDGILWEASGG